jgi:hypothetical protein
MYSWVDWRPEYIHIHEGENIQRTPVKEYNNRKANIHLTHIRELVDFNLV